VSRLPPPSVREIFGNARIILHKLGPGTGPSKSGLVFGEVQSGKTTSMEAVSCLGLDLGFRLVIVLSGRTVILRNQTQIRFHKVSNKQHDTVDSDANALDLGGLEGLPINWLTSDGEDITSRNSTDKLDKLDLSKPVFLILKKTVASLQRLMILLGSDDPGKTLNMYFHDSFRGS
jgi:hypothetical protein